MSSQPIYVLRPSEVFQALESTPDGLSSDQAAERRALCGPNAVREPPPPPQWRIVLGFATHPMALALWGVGALAAAGGRPFMGLVIWAVVLINAGFSFWRERRAGQAVTALKALLPAHARVMRNGVESEVLASDVVPGDVLVLGEGDNVPADARVVEEFGLRADDSILTGEAMPARKMADASFREGLTELERPNLIFAGTSICAGTGRAVVHTTGMQTQFGRIANLTQQVKDEPSQLQQRLERLTRQLVVLALALGGLVFIVYLTDLHMPWVDALVLASGIIVAAVPEGLPATISLALAMAVQRLARQNVLVKRPAIVETLGTTSVICTDKSGTLTQNQMTVRELWVAGRRLAVSGAGYEPKGDITAGGQPAGAGGDLHELLAAAALCNNARLIPPSADRPKWTCLGDQTEAALRVAALKGGVSEETLTLTSPRVHELPFDARRKRMSTIHSGEDGEIAYVKGAPKEVLQLCTHILIDGQAQPLSNSLRAEIIAANDDYARNALRVLALARRDLPPRAGAYTPDSVERQLTFLGLAAMMDPPRPEVAEAIRTCREAGIRWVMITGDYGLTAESVARRIGMLTPVGVPSQQDGRGGARGPRILTGADVDAMTDAELQAALAEEVVCARMAPDHKLRLVAAFQARGDVVAVIGDGVNDAPALRRADIGIAMGVSGTDVAKEAADVVLTQDNFSAIVAAIEEGRAVYDNLRKVMTYIFASNVPEIVPFLVAALFNIPLALTIMQILAIDLGTDLLPAMALGMERPEPDVMRRRPVKRNISLLDRRLLTRAALMIGMVQTVLCYVAFIFVYYQAGITNLAGARRFESMPYEMQIADPVGRVVILATTVFHIGVVMGQIGNAFACRTELGKVRRLGFFSNRFLMGGIAVSLAMIAAMVYIGPLAASFDHVPIPPVYWLGLALFAPAVYLFDWVRRALVRRGKG